MKEYLKMADVFDCELLIDCDCDDAIVDEQSFVVLESFDGSDVAKYAAHAINSHDELVQMNQGLLAALEAIDDCYTDTSRDYLTKSELLHHKAVRDDVASIIEKAKGGADEASDWLEKELKETANLVK